MWVRVTGGCLLNLVLLGCTQATLRPATTPITVDELLAGAALGEIENPYGLVDEHEVLALSPEMERFLDTSVDRSAGNFVKLQQLLSAIIREGSFSLVYDDKTRTASQTFAVRRGNCLSFSNMFVAMARYLRLEVSYQEVDIPPDWTLEDNAYVLNRHVNVALDLGITGEHVVDFNIDDFRASYERRRISDARALAHFYNNMGVERMQAGDTAAALAYFRSAIADNDRRFSPAWTNLGTLYLREGHPDHAEAAYLQALAADRRDLVAMSGLAGLYERLGDRQRAAAFRTKVMSHRKQNPYYRYHLAREAFLARDYDAAIGHLRYAVRKKPHEDLFCFLLGLSYLQQGEERAARRWLKRAEEVAATAAFKRNYADKMEALLSGSK